MQLMVRYWKLNPVYQEFPRKGLYGNMLDQISSVPIKSCREAPYGEMLV